VNEWISREELLADPSRANALSAQALGHNDIPVIPEPPTDFVNFPGGLMHGGQIIKTAQVRELNGSDEEALSRALKSGNAVHLIDTLLARGTVKLGSEPADPVVLKQLLIGDRNELIVGIRNATYGEVFEIENWICPSCGSDNNISLNLRTDLDRRTLEDPANPTITVDLRKGGQALMRLPNGYDEEMFTVPGITRSESNSLMLRQCLISVTDKDGKATRAKENLSLVTNLSIPDRAAIVKAVIDRQPGPQFFKIDFTHEGCGKEVSLALGVGDLFLELFSVL
jgi:hypothetical protein